MTGVPDELQSRFVAYLERLAAVQAPGTVTSRATRLAHFGRFLAGIDRVAPAGLELQLVLGRRSTYELPALQDWLVVHPRCRVRIARRAGGHGRPRISSRAPVLRAED